MWRHTKTRSAAEPEGNVELVQENFGLPDQLPCLVLEPDEERYITT